jgi:N-acetylglucosamine-6-phosphate deacetylase
MKAATITNVRALDPGVGVVADTVSIQDGRIAALGEDGLEGAERVDGGGRLLTPGLIDVHVNGIHDNSFDLGPEHIAKGALAMLEHGTTTFCPTIQPMLGEGMLPHFARLAEEVATPRDGALPLGLHLEGPFMGVIGAATDPAPGDVGLLDEILDACNGQMAVMSVSPEVDGVLPVIERLAEAGVKVFVTHTQAGVDDTIRAIDAGARHATHFYDVFPAPEETDPGVRPVGCVETFLADPRTTVDFICDGIHVHPMAIRAAVAAKGWEGVVLATDGNIGAGLGPGTYETPWGYPVTVAPGDAPRVGNPDHPAAGGLAGSALTMEVGIANLMRWLNLAPEQVWAMGTSNPARLMDLNKGRLRPGADADLVLWDEADGAWTAARTWVGGITRFERT